MTLVVVPDNLGYPSTLPDRFTAGLEDVRHYNDLPDAGEFISRCRDADALIWAWTRLTPAILDQCPNLKIVSFMGVGASDRIDLNHAWAKGIVVCNTPHYGDHAVAELGFAILLALTRRVTRADRSVRESRWEQNELEGVGLLGKTMGVVGLGGSGARMAAFANAFGMRVLATTARPSPQRADEHHVEFVPLDDLLSRSDVVSVHVALTERTRHMIGQEQLALMKPAAFLVNMATRRGCGHRRPGPRAPRRAHRRGRGRRLGRGASPSGSSVAGTGEHRPHTAPGVERGYGEVADAGDRRRERPGVLRGESAECAGAVASPATLSS